jgi:hypothetical protein
MSRFAPKTTELSRHDRRRLSVPGVLGSLLGIAFAATPAKGARNRKRRYANCYPISIPDTPRLPAATLVISTGSRQLSGGVEKYCCADESRFMRCLGSLRKLRSSLDRTGVACLKPGVLGSLLGIAFAATPVKGTAPGSGILQFVTLFPHRIRRDCPSTTMSFRPDPDDCREEWRNHKGGNVNTLDSGDASVHTPKGTGCLLGRTGAACLKPGVLGFTMKFPFAATPVKRTSTRKRRYANC